MKSKFILLICAIVILALGGIIYVLRTTKSAEIFSNFESNNKHKPSATMALTPNSGTHKVSDIFDVKIMLNTNDNEVVGAQTYLEYDPAQLEVQDQNADMAGVQILGGTIFGNQMTNKVENGKITFSAGIPMGSPKYAGTGSLAVIKFKALTASTSNVTFNFMPGSTADTTLVGMDSENQNILTNVADASFVIK